MRVAILTFSNTINYGALLQAYALQEVLCSHGFEAEILQYTNTEIEKKEKNQGISLRKIIKKIVMRGAIDQKVKAFQTFENNYITKGKTLSDDNKAIINDYYDYFITGSDQVWNMKITHNDWTYFLNFVRDNYKKISYAPSFGNETFPEQYYTKAGDILRSYKAISVREESGSNLISRIIGEKAEVVLDPTLLLDKEYWNDKMKFKPPIDHYILVYFPHDKEKVYAFLKELQKKTKLPVVYISISPKIWIGVKTIYGASPDEFLGWINNADYVVTGSFHGTAFSLNLEKQFFYEPSGVGSRIDNLVTITGTKMRSIDNNDVLNTEIDYKEVTPVIQLERDRSIRWLLEALEVR